MVDARYRLGDDLVGRRRQFQCNLSFVILVRGPVALTRSP